MSARLLVGLIGAQMASGQTSSAGSVLYSLDSTFPCSTPVMVNVKAAGSWTAAGGFATDYPSNPHLSPPVVAAHNSDYSLFAPGTLATPGLKNVAETGNPTVIKEELAAAEVAGSVTGTSVGQPTDPTCCGDSVRQNPPLYMDGSHSLLSAVYMLAPSPDWFTGINGFDMCNQQSGMWYQVLLVSSATYDAGTDSATTYVHNNTATDPPGPVASASLPGVSSSGDVPPTATWTLSIAGSQGEFPCDHPIRYKVRSTGTWTVTDFPTDYPNPSNPHLSPPVVVGHNSDYSPFAPGTLATPGLKNVAETGNPTVIKEELAAAEAAGSVLGYSVGMATLPECCGSSVRTNVDQVPVDQSYPFVSSVFMLAPSPDWFSGLYSFSMCNAKTNHWWGYMSLYSRTYDAGTDDASTYGANNSALTPPAPVSEATCLSHPVLCNKGVVQPTAMFFFQLGTVVGNVDCKHNARYEIESTGAFTPASFPTDYPANPFFSAPVAISHNSGYSLFAPGTLATTGLKDVAETGATAVIQSELEAAQAASTIRAISIGVASNTIPSVTSPTLGSKPTTPGQAYRRNKDVLDVSKSHSLLSAVFKIDPSPDWFTGVYNVQMCDPKYNRWLGSTLPDSFFYDAGTDYAPSYVHNDSVIDPAVAVYMRTCFSAPTLCENGAVPPVASWRLLHFYPDLNVHNYAVVVIGSILALPFLIGLLFITLGPFWSGCKKGKQGEKKKNMVDPPKRDDHVGIHLTRW